MQETSSPSPDKTPDPRLEASLALLERGTDAVISSDELRDKLRRSAQNGKPLRIKLGLDPTAPDIHLGHAVVLWKLRDFQDAGHEAHLIFGDFTARIGDPTGKSKTRPQLSREQVRENARTYQDQLFRILDQAKSVIHFNGDWLDKMSFSDVIRLASQYTVAQTLEREDFAARLQDGKPIGLHEIMYPLCQGQDSVHIRADVELGGTDQRFNNLVGRELQRANGQESQVVMLLPLLVGTDGVQKMSKSLGNAIGISEPPSEMFGKVMSIPDEALRQYFVLATRVPLPEVETLLAGHPMEAKKRLGREIVGEYHSAQAAEEAQAAFEKQFSRRETPEEMPEIELPGEAISILDLLRACFEMSGGEARRLVGQGAVAVDEARIEDISAVITPHDGLIVRAGKRRFARVRLVKN